MALRCLSQRSDLVAALLLGLTSLATASDDWDWGAVEEMDDAPIIRPAAPTPPKAPKPPSASAQESTDQQMRREAAKAAPDYQRERVAALEVFPAIGDFSVVAARRDRDMHPCANCHQWVMSNPEPRRLAAPHDNFELEHGMHGKGGFWCLTCHDAKNNMTLKTLEGEAVDYDHSYVVCTQCHVQQGRDWANGAHGKRVANWNGPREVLNCTACHYQHRPAIEPRGPMPGPSIRVGLPRPDHWVAADQRQPHTHEHTSGWRRDVERQRQAPETEPPSDTSANAAAETSDADS
jgi:hypothetical protein